MLFLMIGFICLFDQIRLYYLRYDLMNVSKGMWISTPHLPKVVREVPQTIIRHNIDSMWTKKMEIPIYQDLKLWWLWRVQKIY